MNEIDQILANIDKDDDKLFSGQQSPAPNKKDEEIISLINSLDEAGSDQAAAQSHGAAEPAITEVKPEPQSVGTTSATEQEVRHPDEFSELADLGIYKLRGTKSWNRREPYIMHFNPNALKNDIENLHKSFFFVEGPSDAEDLKLKIKQGIVAFLRRPADHVTARYEEFIYKNIIMLVKEINETYKLDQNVEKLFMYHIGPYTVYKYIKELFMLKKFGYCYKYIPGNKAARFFPDEFIKEIILKWYEQNINTMDIPFDSIQPYEEMKKIVLKRYQKDLRVFNLRIEQLNAKLGTERSLGRSKLFQLKGLQWFGQLNIEIYRRFIGSSIFM